MSICGLSIAHHRRAQSPPARNDFGLTDLSRLRSIWPASARSDHRAVREKRDYEGNEIIASNAAYAKGLTKLPISPTSDRAQDVGTASTISSAASLLADHFDLAGSR